MSPAHSIGTCPASTGSSASSSSPNASVSLASKIAASASATRQSAVTAGTSTRAQMSRDVDSVCEFVEILAEYRDGRVKVGQVSVRGTLGGSVEQSVRAAYPTVADVEVPAVDPGQTEFDGLHRRRRRVCADQLGEHPLGGADGFSTPAQPPCGDRKGVEVIGVQRDVLAGLHERVVGRTPVSPRMGGARRQQELGVHARTGVHVYRLNRNRPK